MTDIAIIAGYLVCVVGLVFFVVWLLVRTAKREVYGDKDPNRKLRETIARQAQSEQPRSHVGGIEALDDRVEK